VRVVDRLSVDRMPTAERRARAWTDVACMWCALGDGKQTFRALRRAEQEAPPQEARRPALRALTVGLRTDQPVSRASVISRHPGGLRRDEAARLYFLVAGGS
jgi:hypothetical protein